MTPAQDPPPAETPHNFAAQKELHQRIRNDPDYDDWEYGTEPLPQEQGGWVAHPKPSPSSEPSSAGPQSPGPGVKAT
ncbi:hypothetical protein KQ313_09195 [Synechococcus sp. CS-1325]|uniref:hypothetical protein n=1 Tax=unclassified Synechococcus TaxID=2626047 RepID=UPI000DB32BEB|nr:MULTISPECIES: hypothetical protein [unclassified Synechococcus]PZU98128.1 MAG: hypothetical protein DCF24_11395 [Cyanobium sp.]MCT0199853.1 hypothetical protein [Synechococcus sp. CS-1325]MCT0214130.1 hypothetical protein [Synechococcus sp. CS-1326]MCT0231403.1 hypothetical protein [Synechococcus sp. CS-1324]MCT0232460.1 hypothetical protein [Synechococcus sp. CS-1327]